MKFSEFFVKTLREPPKDEESVNAKLLAAGGFIQKLAAGIYTFLPLGTRVLGKIENIVREEMNLAGGAELLMPALHPKESWEKTGRWQMFDALFKLKSKSGSDYALGPTHEEILYGLLTHYIKSYKDLPLALYQIQTKFRDEGRAKSGLLRTREFRMKDLYSFHATSQDRDRYYEVMRKAYLKIFKRLELAVVETRASGGTFSELSAEFQTVSPTGEDTILLCEKCQRAVNKEIAPSGASSCPDCGGPTKEKRAIEVGNIFPLKEKFAKDFNLTFKDKNGKDILVQAGCYGLGTSRVMGAIAETRHDEKGLIWPEGVAPFTIHLLAIHGTNQGNLNKQADKIYDELREAGLEVLYDDRAHETVGEKFADADLIGIPWRVVISEKTMDVKKVEIKRRGDNKDKHELKSPKELIKKFKQNDF